MLQYFGMSLVSAAPLVELSSYHQGAYTPYRHVLLTPEQIKVLSTLRPARPIRDIAICWAWIFAAISAVAVYPRWWMVLLAIPVIGNRYYALFIIAHDGMHRRLLPNVRRNDFWNDLLILASIGAITRINNRNHLAHHRYLARPEDPDRHKHGCFNKTTHIQLLGYASGATSLWSTVNAVFLTRGRKSRATSTDAHPEHYSLRDFLLLVGWFSVLGGGLTWLIGWWAYPVLWLLPVYAFMFLSDNFRSFAEHSHPEADAAADRHRLITYLSNRLERMLVAPMNMNFHAAHHLWPSIPYYNLPEADRLIRHQPAAASLEWRGSYFAYFCTYWSSLPIPDCRKPK